MHLSDGIVSLPVAGVGWALSAAALAAGLKKTSTDDIPRLAVYSALFFTVSVIHFPLGAASVHLTLNGLLGIILGWSVLPAVFTALILQAFLLQHGGIVAVGMNTLIIGLPGLAAGLMWNRLGSNWNRKPAVQAAVGILTPSLSLLLLILILLLSDSSFQVTIPLILAVNGPAVILEGIVTVITLSFIQKVKPDLLESRPC